MNDSHCSRVPFAVPGVVALCLLLGGCTFGFGRGATGELVVPRERLRAIEPATMEQIAASAPRPVSTTAPTTLPTTLPVALQGQREVKLTIEQARKLALANNLEIQVQLFDPAIARTSVTEEEGRFEALFNTSANFDKTDTPTSTRLESNQAKNLTVQPGIEIPLVTGGTLRADLPLGRFETDNQFSTLNPAFTSNFVVSFSQPLLRNGGVFTTTQGIRLAFYEYQASQARTKLEIIRVLTVADRAYWRLYAARQEAVLRRQEYDLAVAQMQRARRQANAGMVADVDIIRAESGVADTLENVIIADNQLRDRQRELKRILNSAEMPMDAPVAVVPTTDPRPLRYSVDATELAKAAVANRMEMLETELQIARDVSEIAVARNSALPLVALDYSYSVNGLGRTWDDSFQLLHDNDFADHHLALRVQVPIGNEAALSRVRRALLRRLQTLATRDQRDLQIRQEVYNTVDQLDATWQRMLAARERVVLAARVVEVEQRQFNLGLRTSTDVLDAQTRLANAQSSEVQAIAEYQIAQVDIAQATGTVLGASRVDWAPAPVPK